MTFCRDQSGADCKSGCLQCILWCSIQQVPLGWTVLLWTSIFRVRPSQISINFIAIPDIGYLERDGLGQTGWMGKCKRLVHYEKAWTKLNPDHFSRSSIAPCAWCGTSRKQRVFTHWKPHGKQKMIVQLQSQCLQKEKASSKGEKTC